MTNRQRILVVSPGVLPLPPVLGGAVEQLIARLHDRLCLEFDMEYVSVRAPIGAGESTFMPDARVHYIDSINPLEEFSASNHFELQESGCWQAYSEFCADLCDKLKPDIVHIHNESQLLSVAKEAHKSCRTILHINDEVLTRLPAVELAESMQCCDRLLSCSSHIERRIKEAASLGAVPVPENSVFYNFVDMHEFDPEIPEDDQLESVRSRLELLPGPVVLFVGRMIEEKGPHLALRAVRQTLNDVPNANLLFVGAPWYSRENCGAFVDVLRNESKDIEAHVRFTGYVDHRQMPTYYKLADLVLAPSIWDDPSPFVAYEAQAMQCPIIGGNRGGLPEIIEHGVTGYVLDPFDTRQFSNRLTTLLMDPELATRFGENGRSRVLNQFSLDNSAIIMSRIYRDLLT